MNWLYSKIAAAVAVLGALALACARYLQVKAQRDNAREQRDYLEAERLERDEMDAIEAEVDAEYSDLERISDDESKGGDRPAHIRDRNRY